MKNGDIAGQLGKQPWARRSRRRSSVAREVATHLADAGVADEEELEEIIVLAGMHGVLAAARGR